MNSKPPDLPDFDHCLVNLANSILQHFGAETTAPTLSMADKVLDQRSRNIVVLLLDALGTSILDLHCAPDGFFRSHLLGNYNSVFPPTTVAATTAINTGLFPCENGWLGWDTYFPKLGKNVTTFLNVDSLTEKNLPPEPTDDPSVPPMPPLNEQKPAADFNAAFTYCSYSSVVQKINDAGGNAYFSSPFVEPFPKDIDAILERVTTLCREPGKKYIYAYWNEPDTTMHRYGVKSSEAHDMILSLEEKVRVFAEGLPEDTLLFITADHGHMDSKNFCLMDYPEILDCLVRMPSIEPRALNLFVKEEKKDGFPDLFHKTFGENFLILSRDEVIKYGVFGKGTEHPEFRGMLGDFLAISTGPESILNTHYEAHYMVGGHAGLTKEEYEIPILAVMT
ncbi:MAG: alkaline phosphatase family protein [Clostridiales bacterium]|nr:alkaline phosphatase family protein [Clostridiales bacterium]